MSKSQDIFSDEETSIAHLRALNGELQDKVDSLEEKVEQLESYLGFYLNEDPDEKYLELQTDYKETLIEIVTLLRKGDSHRVCPTRPPYATQLFLYLRRH